MRPTTDDLEQAVSWKMRAYSLSGMPKPVPRNTVFDLGFLNAEGIVPALA
jgi:hypothetical protein